MRTGRVGTEREGLGVVAGLQQRAHQPHLDTAGVLHRGCSLEAGDGRRGVAGVQGALGRSHFHVDRYGVGAADQRDREHARRNVPEGP